MTLFERAYKQLNDQQRQAVDQIDGPVLVIAGPGTGKTQLLSTRVARILNQTDTPPETILCLTFTESGVQAMRQRLFSLIGEAAYDVQISTYHAFGSDLIRRYPEYIGQSNLRPIDELGQDATLRQILAGLPFNNPLRWPDAYLRDLKTFISDAKRALLEPGDIAAAAKDNLAVIKATSAICKEVLGDLPRIDKKSVAKFEMLLDALKDQYSGKFGLLGICRSELAIALDECLQTNKTTPLTVWKNKWLARDDDGYIVMAGKAVNDKLLLAADIYAQYQAALAGQNIYDYDDMVLRAIKALQENPEFKFTLAEQYLYFLLDEFQDTNTAQLRLIELLTDNPIHEGRPNILAVGDDDQAIYAFQGADHSNMLAFQQMYRNVNLITLINNYRSHENLLHVAQNIAGQIQSRLHITLGSVSKQLVAANRHFDNDIAIARHEFVTDAAQYSWLAEKIAALIKSGMPPRQIAVLAPKHKYLQPLLPYLSAQTVAVQYEKRENVLDDQLVRELETMARLVVALQNQDFQQADSLWPTVLSFDFWQLPTKLIWKLSWEAYDSGESWTTLAMNQEKLSGIAVFFARLADLMLISTAEQQLDLLIGNADEALYFELNVQPVSTFFEYYFSQRQITNSAARYLQLLSSLTVLRQKLRDYKRYDDTPLTLADFIEFIDAHRAAEIPIINTSPYYESPDAVQLMTAYKAKGLEFDAVFVIACQDDVWGRASRTQTSAISLPANLLPIRYAGATEDERLRLFFVAATRARCQLYLTSYVQTISGKASPRLRYLREQIDDSGQITSLLLPGGTAINIETVTADNLPQADLFEHFWQHRHRPPFKTTLKDMLTPRLANYKLSPTHLNHFTDLLYGGPEDFFLGTILRFPKSPTADGTYGNAVHETIEWLHHMLKTEGGLPANEQTLEYFAERIKSKRLPASQTDNILHRGRQILPKFLQEYSSEFKTADLHERNFRSEGVLVGKIHLSGKIDKIRLDTEKKTAIVTDFKTGRGYSRWVKSELRLHKYRQQLLTYKILIEGSHSFRGYSVASGELVFVEPDENGKVKRLVLDFNDEELARHKQLLKAMWQCVQTMDFPDTSGYPPTVNGIEQFENDLIAGLKS